MVVDMTAQCALIPKHAQFPETKNSWQEDSEDIPEYQGSERAEEEHDGNEKQEPQEKVREAVVEQPQIAAQQISENHGGRAQEQEHHGHAANVEASAHKSIKAAMSDLSAKKSSSFSRG
jgi:hypothetical protein